MTPRPKPKPGEVSELEKMRAQTNYGAKRISGHAPFPKAALADLMRLTGLSGGRVLTVLVVEATGRRVEKDEPFLEVTEPISTARLAELCFLDERTIQREIKDLKKRKVISITERKKGLYEFQPLFRTWANLPDYAPAPVAEPESEEEAKDDTVTRLTEKPVRVTAGKKSKPVKVDCGVDYLQFLANIDADFDPVVQGGVLLVNLQYAEASKSNPGRSNAINNLNPPPRQASRDDHSETTGKGTKGERGTKSETPQAVHPRAVELSNLFDPLIFSWCKKTLSGDAIALSKACEAIGNTPHDELVRAAVERGGRTLTPLHVPSVCKEIAHNWEKAKGMPSQKKLPTREEIDAMIAAEKKELAAKNAALRRGRVA